MSRRVFNMVSVPYTGTRFLRAVLDANHCPPVEQIHTHAEAEWHRWFEGWVLCPMRDPILHAIGVMNREHGEPRLADFGLLASLANERTHFFCLGLDRDVQARALAEWLGRDLLIDWTPVGTKPDRLGWRQKYLDEGWLPDPDWPRQIGDGAHRLLWSLGYRMPWLEV